MDEDFKGTEAIPFSHFFLDNLATPTGRGKRLLTGGFGGWVCVLRMLGGHLAPLNLKRWREL